MELLEFVFGAVEVLAVDVVGHVGLVPELLLVGAVPHRRSHWLPHSQPLWLAAHVGYHSIVQVLG